MAVEYPLTLGALPIDVVYEILGHLTVHDLLRTRRVSLIMKTDPIHPRGHIIDTTSRSVEDCLQLRYSGMSGLAFMNVPHFFFPTSASASTPLMSSKQRSSGRQKYT